MKHLVILFFSLLVLVACHPAKENPVDVAKEEVPDSQALKLALLPTVDCLPLYYAKNCGLCDSLGLDLEILSYNSLFDCDTAVLGTAADGAISDLVRAVYYKARRRPLSVVLATNGAWGLVSAGSLRVKKMAQLNERLVGLSRFSAADYFCALSLSRADMGYESVLRAQINNLYLRLNMLNETQIEAAVLPEPFLTAARVEGHRVLQDSLFDGQQMGCLVFNNKVLKDNRKREQVKLLVKVYNIAAEILNKEGVRACAPFLTNVQKFSPETVARLRLPKYTPAVLPRQAEVEKAKEFLVKRAAVRNNAAVGDLLVKDFIP